MEIWKIFCWSATRNYNVYVEAEDAEQANRKSSDCIDEYNKTSEIFDFVYYRESPELVLVLPEGTKLNKLIHVKRSIAEESFNDFMGF